VKAVVIGTGLIARQHLGCLRELSRRSATGPGQNRPLVEIAGVCDLSRAMAESAAERFAAPVWFINHLEMLEKVRPDVVHVTTPPPSHFALASDALRSGAHVIVEKPATLRHEQLETLLADARARERIVLEDYNYVFNSQVQQILRLIESGEFGQVVHVEVFICLDILGKASAFADPNLPHPALKLKGGAIGDFLTHLASLAYWFIGPHKSAQTIWSKRGSDMILPSDEFRALVDAERGTAMLGFSAHSQPDTFILRVHGTKMRAWANLFETRLSIERLMGGPKPLMPMRNALADSRSARRDAFGGLQRKLSGGPAAYEGLWELLSRTYEQLDAGKAPPITMEQVADVNRLVTDLSPPPAAAAIVAEARAEVAAAPNRQPA
jgi:predicted dehydrogenase